MSNYMPDRWVMLKIQKEGQDPVHKILAGWGGSYTHGASWKLNSGITKVIQEDDQFLFEGSSGSVYECRKNCWGLSAYTALILENFQKNVPEDVTIEVIDEHADIMSIEYK